VGRETTASRSYDDVLRGEYGDFLPHADLVPHLSAEEVERFVGLGKVGRELFRSGDDLGAEAAFRGQLAIFPPNPEPWVYLALIDASRGEKAAAVENLRAAVVRGFTDLQRVERSEAWARMGRPTELLRLLDNIPALVEMERGWPAWDSFRVARPPADLASALEQHATRAARIEALAPALGPRLERLWSRLLDRATASILQAYVTKRPDAPDFTDALNHLMTLYAGGPLRRWQVPPQDAAAQLARLSDTVLGRFPDSDMRPTALVARALARNAERDDRGRLSAAAAEAIRGALDEVVARHTDSPVVGTALVGLVRTEAETGRFDHAERQYRRFRDSHASDADLMQNVRDDLGELALRAGGLPRFSATTLDGQTIEPAALDGKVVVFDFWATWCQPCNDGFPALRRIDEKHGDDVLVLGVNLDWTDDISTDDLRTWIAQQDVPGRHLHDGQSWDSEIVRAFGVKEIPFSVVVGADGEILAVNEHGRRLEKTVRAAVQTASLTR
jgi:thiol-disulfide isomerase/thioredoxin